MAIGDAQRGARVALRIQVDDERLESLDGQRRGQVHRRGGLADAALLVGDGEQSALARPAQAAGRRCAAPAWRARRRRRSGCRIRDVSRETSVAAEAPCSEPNGSCGALIGSPSSTVGAAASRTGAGLPRRATTTVVGGDRYFTPHSTTLASVAPNEVITRRCSRTSSARPLPLDRQHPAARSQQRHAPPRQLVQRGHRPGDDGVASAGALADRGLLGAAAHHLDVEPEFANGHCEEIRSAAAAIRSARHRGPGLAIASASPGRPAPLPMSATRSPGSSSSATTAQFRRWRSQIRSISCGPSSPHSTPASASNSAYCWAMAKRGPKIAVATSGGGGIDGHALSGNDMFHVKHPSRRCLPRPNELHPCNSPPGSVDQYDDAARRLHALALAAHPVDRRDGVVNDLALERRHRRQFLALASFPVPAGRPCRPAPPTRRGGGGASSRCQASAGCARRSSGVPPAGSAPAARRAPRPCGPPTCSGRRSPSMLTTARLALDVQVDVAVEVQEVQQLLQDSRRRSRPRRPTALRYPPRCALVHRRVGGVCCVRGVPCSASRPSPSKLVGLVSGCLGVRHILFPSRRPGLRPAKSAARIVARRSARRAQRLRFFGLTPGRGVRPAGLPSPAT